MIWGDWFMSYIFISYSKRDIEFGRYLRGLLGKAGFEVWMDELGIDPSEAWWEDIEQSITNCGAFVVIMSPNARESRWVRRELLLAERLQKPIFPVLLDGDAWSQLADIQYENMRAGLNGNLSDRLVRSLRGYIPNSIDTDSATLTAVVEEYILRARRAILAREYPLTYWQFVFVSEAYTDGSLNFTPDALGVQAMLRGALEYDYAVEAWWARGSDNDHFTTLRAVLHSARPRARATGVQQILRLSESAISEFYPELTRLLNEDDDPRVLVAVLEMLQTILDDRAAPWYGRTITVDLERNLMQCALTAENASVRECAARTIARVGAAGAAIELGRQSQQRRAALTALIHARDEIGYLPQQVNPMARGYAWLANTVHQFWQNPRGWVRRFVFAVIGGTVGMTWYALMQLPAVALFFAERWSRSVITGLSFGLMIGACVLLAAELPERLFKQWSWWGRLILSAALGFISGTWVWVIFSWFFLFLEPETNVFIGGLGFALAFALRAAIRVPAWLAVIWAAACIYLPIYVTWEQYLPPLIYTRPDEHINPYALLIALSIAVGAYFDRLIYNLYRLVKRGLSARTPAAAVIPGKAA